MANTNKFRGLHRGPIDHDASSVINAIAAGAVAMGSVVLLDDGAITSAEILPRVTDLGGNQGSDKVYGIAVGGDNDGIYGTGADIETPTDATRATLGAGEGVVVVTQGRCPARVRGSTAGGTPATISIGDQLCQSNLAGILEKAVAVDKVIAIALNRVTADDLDIIAVDVQREGIF